MLDTLQNFAEKGVAVMGFSGIIGNMYQMHFAYPAILLWHTFTAVAMFCALLIRVTPKISK